MGGDNSVNKIAIIGSGGAGKSTLAQALGNILHLPVIHLDALYWHPGWVPTGESDWDMQMEELVAREQWIIDGNYGRTIDIRLEAADTIIFLDYPTVIPLLRVIKRRLQYHGKTRPDMNEGCNEKLDMEFLKWITNYRRDKRPSILRKLESYRQAKQVLIFSSPKQLKQFIRGLEEQYKR